MKKVIIISLIALVHIIATSTYFSSAFIDVRKVAIETEVLINNKTSLVSFPITYNTDYRENTKSTNLNFSHPIFYFNEDFSLYIHYRVYLPK